MNDALLISPLKEPHRLELSHELRQAHHVSLQFLGQRSRLNLLQSGIERRKTKTVDRSCSVPGARMVNGSELSSDRRCAVLVHLGLPATAAG